MVDLHELTKCVGRSVELHFVDGHIVRAKLVSVDANEPTEIIYDIQEIIAVGPTELAVVTPGTVAAADPSLLAEVRSLD
jgi:hypothetical protein